MRPISRSDGELKAIRRAVKATIERRPPSGGRVLLQAYRLQSGRSELSASA